MRRLKIGKINVKKVLSAAVLMVFTMSGTLLAVPAKRLASSGSAGSIERGLHLHKGRRAAGRIKRLTGSFYVDEILRARQIRERILRESRLNELKEGFTEDLLRELEFLRLPIDRRKAEKTADKIFEAALQQDDQDALKVLESAANSLGISEEEGVRKADEYFARPLSLENFKEGDLKDLIFKRVEEIYSRGFGPGRGVYYDPDERRKKETVIGDKVLTLIPERTEKSYASEVFDEDVDVIPRYEEGMLTISKFVREQRIMRLLINGREYEIVTNNRPITKFAMVMARAYRNDAELRKHLQVLTTEKIFDGIVFNEATGIPVCFNGWEAGASIKQFHFQLFPKETIPIFRDFPLSEEPLVEYDEYSDFDEGLVVSTLREDNPNTAVVFHGHHRENRAKYAGKFIQKLVERNIPHNVAIFDDRVYIFLRKASGEREYKIRNSRVGILELCGVVNVYDEEDYRSAVESIERLDRYLSMVAYGKEDTYPLIDDTLRDIMLGLREALTLKASGRNLYNFEVEIPIETTKSLQRVKPEILEAVSKEIKKCLDAVMGTFVLKLTRGWDNNSRNLEVILLNVMMEMAQNAMDSVLESGTDGRLTVNAKVADGKLRVEFTDSGARMDDYTALNLFWGIRGASKAIPESEDGVRKVYLGGYGLGLMKCVEMLGAYKGSRLGFYHSPQEQTGKTFYFSIPVNEIENQDEVAANTVITESGILIPVEITGGVIAEEDALRARIAGLMENLQNHLFELSGKHKVVKDYEMRVYDICAEVFALLTNAVSAVKESGRSGHVSLSLTVNEQGAAITVCDSGDEFRHENILKVFFGGAKDAEKVLYTLKGFRKKRIRDLLNTRRVVEENDGLFQYRGEHHGHKNALSILVPLFEEGEASSLGLRSDAKRSLRPALYHLKRFARNLIDRITFGIKDRILKARIGNSANAAGEILRQAEKRGIGRDEIRKRFLNLTAQVKGSIHYRRVELVSETPEIGARKLAGLAANVVGPDGRLGRIAFVEADSTRDMLDKVKGNESPLNGAQKKSVSRIRIGEKGKKYGAIMNYFEELNFYLKGRKATILSEDIGMLRSFRGSDVLEDAVYCRQSGKNTAFFTEISTEIAKLLYGLKEIEKQSVLFEMRTFGVKSYNGIIYVDYENLLSRLLSDNFMDEAISAAA